MMEQGIALCRISSEDQTKGHSLEAQDESISKTANNLNVKIVKTWTEVKTSKKGKNFGRKDLEEMLRYCKQNKKITYLFIDFMNRLMREVEVMIYYKVLFNQMGVTLYFCDSSQQHLNGENQTAQLMRLIEGFKSEQENTARQETTIARMKARYAAGYYISHPHPGYIKSDIPGLHIPDPKRFNILQKGSRLIIYEQYTISQAVRWMNDNGYLTNGGKKLDTNHYIESITNRYYCGTIDVSTVGWPKDVDGLHEPMFSRREHQILLSVINKRNPQLRRKHNPEFPLSNLIRHEECNGMGHYEKFTGHFYNRGKRPNGRQRPLKPVYDCRNCRQRISREVVHNGMSQQLSKMEFLPDEKRFREALVRVWRRQRGSVTQRLNMLQINKIKTEQKMKETTATYASETDESIKQSLGLLLKDYDAQINQINTEIATTQDVDMESEGFVRFALDFTANLREKWWELSWENLARGEQILFNGKIYIDNSAKVHTPLMSSIYRLGTNKKALEFASNAHLVELPGTTPGSVGL